MKYEANEKMTNELLSNADPFYREMVKRTKESKEKTAKS